MSSRARSTVRIAAAVIVLSALALPAIARAETFFVSTAGSGEACSEASPCNTISQALITSRGISGTGDEIHVGPGVYEERVVINDANDAGLTLRGAGRGPDQTATPSDATTVRSPETNKGAEIALTTASGVTIEALRVEVPAGFINTAGISLGVGLTGAPDATVRDVHVQSFGDMNTGAIEVGSKTSGASVLDARVRHHGSYWGIAIFGPNATVADADVFTAQGQALDTEGFAETTRVVRSRFETEGGFGATIRSPDVVIDSSLFLGGSIGVEAYEGFGGINQVTLSNDTIDVGQPKVDDNGGTAARARAESGSTVSIAMVNSIAVEEQEVEGNATASVSCESSMVQPQTETVAAGTVSCGSEKGNLFAPASSLFAAGADWHLVPGSVAVDSGVGGDALSATDLDGAPRLIDGNGDGTAVIDRGAYELATPSPSATGTSPSNAFKFRKLKRNKRKGTAKLQVEVPGPGHLVLFGKKVKKSLRDAKAAGTFGLKVIPKAKLAHTLKSKGTARTSVRVRFTPTGGTANERAKALKLIRKR